MKKMKKLLLTVATAVGVTTVGATAVNADTITVKAGDTLSKIANEHNTTIDNLQKLNNLSDINLIYVGEQLKINDNNAQQQVATTVAVNNGTAANNSAAQQSTQTAQQNTQPVVQNESYNTTSNNNNDSSTSSNLSGSEAAARQWIMARESGGNYNARNGQYVGAYQLSESYLGGNYSPANQDRVANQYVSQRYGSWVNAQKHWENFGWY